MATQEPGQQPSLTALPRLEDLPKSVALLRQVGVKLRNEIVAGPGGKQILAEDPDGNPVEFFEPA